MKKIITLLTAMALACSCFIFSVSAASTASISLSSKSPKVNDTVTVTVTVKSGAAMYGTEFNVNYNQSVLKFVSGDSANGGAGVVKVASGVTGATSQSYSLKFTAIAAGSSTISVSGGAFLETADETISASASLNVSDASKSTNANLSSLRTSAGSLSPKFSANTTSYTVNVKKNITECKVYCSTADPNATVSVVGSATLKIGENKRVVTVTAPSGAQKSYTLTIIRSNEEEEVVSNTSSSVTEPSALETVIGGVSYVVIRDISSIELPVGFNITKRLYNNEEISVAMDAKENFELFYLKASGSNEAYPYTYDSENNVFNKVQIITQGSNSYIVSDLPEDLIVPEGYISKTVKIQEMSIKAFASTDVGFEDMYYIYCYFNGEYNMYRYDNIEKILQRSPEVKLVSAKGEPTDSSNIEFVNRFNKLSTNAKTIVVCLLIAFVGVIALTVLLIIKLIKRSRHEDFDLVGYEEDFDSVRFDDNFEIIPETPDDETED